MIAEGVYPHNSIPCKFQIVQMLACAVREGFVLTPQDISDFNLDERGLAHGVVDMALDRGQPQLSLDQMRRKVPGVWKRMTPHQRAAFLVSYAIAAFQYIDRVMGDMSNIGLDVQEDRKAVCEMGHRLFMQCVQFEGVDVPTGKG
jgi:hypothetical protein